MDIVFKALADPTRRHLLDRLHEHNGQTLGELCEGVAMARQSATQHLALLEAANLVSTVRRGREKLHYLNPVPLHEIQERWIDKFERPRLRALSTLKRRAEEDHD
jgi:DNA-binding transcriptional ArsR family regulator